MTLISEPLAAPNISMGTGESNTNGLPGRVRFLDIVILTKSESVHMKNFYTHGGFFHADEVTAYAILSLARVCDNFVRLTDISNIPDDGIVGDIGREWNPLLDRFDHHQGFYTRDNGMPLATAGMVWQKYGLVAIVNTIKGLSHKHAGRVFEIVEKNLIEGIDAHDADNAFSVSATCSGGNVRVLTLSQIVAGMNTDDVSDVMAQDYVFKCAFVFVIDVIRTAIRSAHDLCLAEDKFMDTAQFKGKYIVLPEPMPWREIVCEKYPEVLYVVHPSSHPGSEWALLATPLSPETRELKRPIERSIWFDGFIHQGKWIAGGTFEEMEQLAKDNTK